MDINKEVVDLGGRIKGGNNRKNGEICCDGLIITYPIRASSYMPSCVLIEKYWQICYTLQMEELELMPISG